MSFFQIVRQALHIVIFVAMLVASVFLVLSIISNIKKDEEKACEYFATSLNIALPCAICIAILAIISAF